MIWSIFVLAAVFFVCSSHNQSRWVHFELKGTMVVEEFLLIRGKKGQRDAVNTLTKYIFRYSIYFFFLTFGQMQTTFSQRRRGSSPVSRRTFSFCMPKTTRAATTNTVLYCTVLLAPKRRGQSSSRWACDYHLIRHYINI